jgi:hypothetical protein
MVEEVFLSRPHLGRPHYDHHFFSYRRPVTPNLGETGFVVVFDVFLTGGSSGFVVVFDVFLTGGSYYFVVNSLKRSSR